MALYLTHADCMSCKPQAHYDTQVSTDIKEEFMSVITCSPPLLRGGVAVLSSYKIELYYYYYCHCYYIFFKAGFLCMALTGMSRNAL